MEKKTRRIDDFTIEVPIGYVPDMKVPGKIYVDKFLEQELEEHSIQQTANTATLPGIVGAALAMPDIHTGYGFPIGGVAAMDIDQDGVISPGGVGYDINCGVRLVKSNLTRGELKPKIRDLVALLYSDVPSGVGSKSKLRLTSDREKEVLTKGAKWAVEMGYGDISDLEHIESGGCLEGADPNEVSDKAYERGRSQVGTLGSGNHFLEIQYVDEIFDEQAANAYGLFRGQITVMIHSGSRGFGHQVCTDFIDVMEKAVKKYGIKLPDRELACAPFSSPESQRYLAAMRAAANYAWANRQCMMHWTREAFIKIFNISPSNLGMELLYDVAHNIAKIEEHIVDGKKRKLVVHRKGATRAYPPGHEELSPLYRNVGQPVLIPGDMERQSYVLAGTSQAMDVSFGSTCHGAGRVMSRHKAIKKAKGRAIAREMEDKGIIVRSTGKRTLAEEIGEAYKDVSHVVDVVDRAGIAKKVARLKPLGVVKG